MKALIKHASLSNLLTVCAPFAALADLIDAQRALLNGQFSEALEFAHEIADTHAVDAVCPSLVKVSEVGVQIRSTSACPAEEYVSSNASFWALRFVICADRCVSLGDSDASVLSVMVAVPSLHITWFDEINTCAPNSVFRFSNNVCSIP